MSDEEKFSVEEGKMLINFVRENIEYFLKNNKRIGVPEEIKQKFANKYGAFVTLNQFNVLIILNRRYRPMIFRGCKCLKLMNDQMKRPC